jgi:hypothetical protein
MRKFFVSLLVIVISCKGNEPDPIPDSTQLYFPRHTGTTWETTTPASLGWDESKIPELKTFLRTTNSRAH